MGTSQVLAHDCARIHALATLLADDAVDAAIDAGLMETRADLQCARCAEDAQRVCSEQRRLRDNWAARERYRARASRLRQRVEERQARRTPAPSPIATQITMATPTPPLPAAAAAVLARAKARAAERSGS